MDGWTDDFLISLLERRVLVMVVVKLTFGCSEASLIYSLEMMNSSDLTAFPQNLNEPVTLAFAGPSVLVVLHW